MNAIIIEDEKLSAEHLCNLLKKIDESITVRHTFDSIRQSINAFNNGIRADPGCAELAGEMIGAPVQFAIAE